MSKLKEFLDEGVASGLERFDVPKETLKDMASIGKELTSFSKRAKKMDGGKALNWMKSLYDELFHTINDFEDYLSGELEAGQTNR